MKTLFLICAAANDGGRGTAVAAGLSSQGLAFATKTYGVDTLPHLEIPTLPVVIIDVDGKIHQSFADRPGAEINAAAVATAWASAPNAGTPALYVDIVTKRFDGANWVPETVKFAQNEAIQVSGSVKLPNGAVYAGVTSDFFVPLFAGLLNTDGTVSPTDEQLCILKLHVEQGVATPVTFSINKSTVVCGVPGRSSNWIRALFSRIITAAPAE